MTNYRIGPHRTGCQSTCHTVNSSQPKIVWRVDQRLKHCVVTRWPAPQTPCCQCCDECSNCHQQNTKHNAVFQCCLQYFSSRYAAARSVCSTFLCPTASRSQAANRRNVTRRLDSGWHRMWDDSFRRVSCTSSNSVSVPSSCIGSYMLSCPRLALWFRCRCQPSMSLDRTLRLNTDHDEGGHVLESIHVDWM